MLKKIYNITKENRTGWISTIQIITSIASLHTFVLTGQQEKGTQNKKAT